ncbi:toll-Interleukin receptor [Enterobacter mori]|uniref:toll-Interleukin receptor n=1 Tax=Enterobacter mori TaxID=539813 RepID=UPI002DBE0A08|nr:toll-Interleukin receptor [Enterobacter mori]MEB7915917.1 toll/interleukin-1 receptor domain-containing protein [Enterobacter mori]
MKVFISWSGQRSKVVAEIFSDWLKCVIQASQPWISTRDIDRGAIWFSEINDKLKDVSVGVVFLTQENKNKPWILFETGALAKGLTTNRVCTFLIDLNPEDLQDPLAQFNHTAPNENSVWELTRTINTCLVEKALDERILKQVFNTYWPQFEQSFETALHDFPPDEVIPPRSEQDILSEILNNTRVLTQRVRALENSKNEISEIITENKYITKKKASWALQKKISDMVRSGAYSEDEMVSSLVEMSDAHVDYIRDLVRYYVRKNHVDNNNGDMSTA